MKKLCKFSVLRYIPSENREEFINIGLVFHAPSDGYINFKATKNFSRVKTFDDEIDIEFLKLILEGVEEEFTQSTVHGPSLKAIDDNNFLEKQTAFYANQLQFSPIKVIRSNNVEKDFDDLFKTYVYFDVKRNKRITDNEVKSIMNRVFQGSELINKLDKNHIFNFGTEDITLDYSYKSKNDSTKFIKTLSFDYSNTRSKYATQLAKEWAWNFIKISEQPTKFTNISKDDLLTVVYVSETDTNIDSALEILNERSKTISVKNEESIKLFANEILCDVQ